MAIELEFISSDVLSPLDEGERMDFILDKMKKNKILVVEESFSSLEEAKLIEATMDQIDDKFPGIEVSTLREKEAEGMRERLIRFLGGRTGGMTIIGPSKLIKKVKKNPRQILLSASEK